MWCFWVVKFLKVGYPRCSQYALSFCCTHTLLAKKKHNKAYTRTQLIQRKTVIKYTLTKQFNSTAALTRVIFTATTREPCAHAGCLGATGVALAYRIRNYQTAAIRFRRATWQPSNLSPGNRQSCWYHRRNGLSAQPAAGFAGAEI